MLAFILNCMSFLRFLENSNRNKYDHVTFGTRFSNTPVQDACNITSYIPNVFFIGILRFLFFSQISSFILVKPNLHLLNSICWRLKWKISIINTPQLTRSVEEMNVDQLSTDEWNKSSLKCVFCANICTSETWIISNAFFDWLV